MFGPPKDVIGECNARLYLGDDYGDNVCTIRCSRPVGHDGPHKEEFQRGGGKPVVITWHVDERDEENFDNSMT
jgi:hypothetical protein